MTIHSKDAGQSGDRCGDGSPTVRVDYPSAAGFIADYVANVSHGDTVIRSARQLEVGQSLRLAISFPGLLVPVKLEGRVNWARTPPRGAGGASDERGGELAYGIELFCEGGDWPSLGQLVERIQRRDASVVAPATVRVLVAEDNRHLADLIRRGLEAHLQRSGQDTAFEIHHADNGLTAFEHAQQERYDALIVDVYLPMMDGLQLITRLRQDPRYAEVPVIAISAAEDVEAQALQVGADLFLRKPIRLLELLRAMERLALGTCGPTLDGQK